MPTASKILFFFLVIEMIVVNRRQRNIRQRLIGASEIGVEIETAHTDTLPIRLALLKYQNIVLVNLENIIDLSV